MANGTALIIMELERLRIFSYCPSGLRQRHKHLGFSLRPFCQRLVNEGLLFPVGFDRRVNGPYNEQFVSARFRRELADYGAYSFTVHGFPEIVRHFSKSVISLTVEPSDSHAGSGTAFLLENNLMVTAAHCLPAASLVSIDGWDSQQFPVKKIVTFARDSTDLLRPERGLTDLAILEFANDPYPDASKFRLWVAEILSDCLVMGFPSIQGFENCLLSGTGQIVSEHYSYNRKQNLIFVDAS